MANVAFVANEVRDGERAQAFQEVIRTALEPETGLWWASILLSDPSDSKQVTVWLRFLGSPVYLSRRPDATATIRGLREEDWVIEGADGPEALARSLEVLVNRHR